MIAAIKIVICFNLNFFPDIPLKSRFLNFIINNFFFSIEHFNKIFLRLLKSFLNKILVLCKNTQIFKALLPIVKLTYRKVLLINTAINKIKKY